MTTNALVCVIASFLVVLLISCEDGKKPQLVTTVTPLDKFEPSGGIERISLSHPRVNTVYHIYSKNLQSKYLIPEVRPQLNNLPEVYTLNLSEELSTGGRILVIAEKYKNKVILSGESIEVTSYRDVDSDVRVYYAHKDSVLTDIMTYGPRFSGTLPKGLHTYRGANLLTVNHDEMIYEGEFQLQVNFNLENNQGKFMKLGDDENKNFAIAQLPASDGGRFLVLTGEFDINFGNGTFSSDAMNLGFCASMSCLENEIFDNMDASIHGSLLGEDATGIAGIYHDNSDSPTYIGALIGSDALRSSN